MRSLLLKAMVAAMLVPPGMVDHAPVEVPYLLVGPTVAVEASVEGGKRLMVLDAGTATSMLRDAPRANLRLAVGVGGRRLGEIAFAALNVEAKTEEGRPADGSLGLDALRGLALGVDLDVSRAALWSKGGLDPKVAEAWVRGPGVPSDAPVAHLPLATLPDGEFGVSLDVGGRRTVAALRVRAWGSYLLPPVRTPVHPFGFATIVPGVKVAGEPIPWLFCPMPSSVEDKSLTSSASKSGSAAMIALDALDSPRALVDFAAKTLYVRRLSADEKLTRLLRRASDASVTVQGDRILVAPSGSTSQTYPPEFSGLVGREVLRIAGAPASEWLAALRDPSEAGAAHLARLLDATSKSYSFSALDSDGDEQEVKVSRDE